MAFDAVLFDKDGTLFDFSATWDSWSADIIKTLSGDVVELARRLAQSIQYDLLAGRFYPDSFAIAGTNAEVAAALGEHLPAWSQSDLEEFLSQSAATAPLVPAVPLPDFLDKLRHAGLKLGVMTNDTEHSALAQLGRAGVRDRFEFIAGCDSGLGAKPDPAPLLAFAKAVDADPSRCIMVGDSLHDLYAGKAAGMARIGVLTGMAGRADLEPHADVVLDNIGEIPNWMRRVR